MFGEFAFLAAAPWLPEPALMRSAWPLAWALVLAAAALWLAGCVAPRWRWYLAVALGTWCLWPGAASPAYWLALAFQSPSLTSAALCGVWLVQQGHRLGAVAPGAVALGHGRGGAVWGKEMTQRCAGPDCMRSQAKAALPGWLLAQAAGIVLGWVLLADLLALWPVSVYAWGFAPAALMLVAGMVAALWLVPGASHAGASAGLALAIAVTVFTLTRLPTGNIWDAMLDPWLWLCLQVVAFRQAIRWRGTRLKSQ